MLTARKSRLANALIYRALVVSAVRASFHTVNLRQDGPPPGPLTGASGAPVVLFANHCSWWDGYMLMLANQRRWRLDAYLMMEERQLARYPFFRYAGAFSVDRDNPRSAARSIAYAAQLLTAAPGRGLLIFPQGRILANDRRPLGFYGGAGHLVKRLETCLARPVALRYEFIGEQKPDAFISIGAPLHFAAPNDAPRDITARLEASLAAELDRVRDEVLEYRFAGYDLLASGAWSVNRLWDAARGRGPLRPVGPEGRPHH
jgi:1-acyl-sn-glycerol-3-phosphate acyltransferase